MPEPLLFGPTGEPVLWRSVGFAPVASSSPDPASCGCQLPTFICPAHAHAIGVPVTHEAPGVPVRGTHA